MSNVISNKSPSSAERAAAHAVVTFASTVQGSIRDAIDSACTCVPEASVSEAAAAEKQRKRNDKTENGQKITTCVCSNCKCRQIMWEWLQHPRKEQKDKTSWHS